MPFVLSDSGAGGGPAFSLQVIEGVPSGPNGHWTLEESDRLEFNRKVDAENFQKFYLRNLPHIVVKEV